MNRIIKISLTFILVAILGFLTPVAAGNGKNPQNIGDRMNSDGCLVDGTPNMEVTGTVELDDTITLTISILHDYMMMDNEMQSMMEGENTIIVKITSLVEFEDLTNDGYTTDDVIVSKFLLNNLSLDLTIVEDNYFLIESKDNDIFQMKVDLTLYENILSGFKWSMWINYPFASDISDLAIIQTIDTEMGQMAYQHRMQNGYENGTNYRMYENKMMDGNPHLPMFFSWINEVDIDGTTHSVIATVEGENVVISFPQGDSIYYDPEMGIEASVFSSMINNNENLDELSFYGLIMGIVALPILLILKKIRK